MKAKAIVFDKVKKVVLRNVELPKPTPEDIVIENDVSGVSVGTERWALIGKRAEIQFPNIPGYMGIGHVLSVGKDAAKRGYKVGDRVNYGASRLTAPLDGKSWMSTHLSHAVVNVCSGVEWDPEGFNGHRCEFLPANLDPLDASLCALAAVAQRGIEMAVIPAGTKVLVSGLGVIGQYAAQICRLKGAQVAVTDVVEARLDVARQLGAEWVINVKKEKLAERAAAIAPKGFDVIIDTSSIPAVVNGLFPFLKLWGKFVFQGWYPPPSALDLNAVHMRLPTCFVPCGHTGRAVATAMRWVAAGKLNTRSLITHVVKPEEAPEMYDLMVAGSEKFLGVVFDWR
jgi:bacteriochlorophyllide a dehydrogenase